jgi:hypothetical protein
MALQKAEVPAAQISRRNARGTIKARNGTAG